MSEDDPDRRLKMFYWFLSKQDEDSEFLSTVIFSNMKPIFE